MDSQSVGRKRERDLRVRHHRDGMVAAAMRAGAGMGQRALGQRTGFIGSRGFQDRPMLGIGTKPQIGKIVLGAGGRSPDLHGEDQQHQYRQPRGSTQAGEHGMGRDRIHTASIAGDAGVMEFHPRHLRFMASSSLAAENYFRNKRMPLPTTSRLAPMSANTAAHIVA